MGWATFGGDFLQTHRVTMLATSKRASWIDDFLFVRTLKAAVSKSTLKWTAFLTTYCVVSAETFYFCVAGKNLAVQI
jgi:hypothetical protein